MSHFICLADEGTEKLSNLTHITQLVSDWAKIHTQVSVWLQSLYPSLGDHSGQGQALRPRARGAGLGVGFGVASTALGRAGEFCTPGCHSLSRLSGLRLL